MEPTEDDPNRILGELYAELRRLAATLVRGRGHDSLLQPTALVHEACLKLFGHETLEKGNRVQLLGLATEAMRNLLVDRARARNRDKRCPAERRVSFEQIALAYEDRAVDLESLNGALSDLRSLDERLARLVELRFYGGLTMDEIADVLGSPLRAVERDWQFARRWLKRRMQ